MKPPVETVRISKQGRDHLIKLRRQTGIENWNILCRWAFAVSLREPTTPLRHDDKLEGGVEMSWKVFSGEESEIYSALLVDRCKTDGFESLSDGPGICLRAHLHRGLAYLSSGVETKSISDFAQRWTQTDR